MRVLFREGYVEEVTSVAVMDSRDKDNNVEGIQIEFTYASNFDAEKYDEPVIYKYDDSLTKEEAEKRANALVRELFEKGYADFSTEPMDICI